MTTETPQTFAACKFKYQRDDDLKTYDYVVPDGLTVANCDKVVVETKRGETTVEVVEVKYASDKATASILRIAPVEEEKPVVVETMDF